MLTIAAATVLHAVGSIVPEWTATVWSPFDRRVRRAGDVPGSAEIGRIRARMSGRRQRIADGRWLPPETLRLLQPSLTDYHKPLTILNERDQAISGGDRRKGREEEPPRVGPRDGARDGQGAGGAQGLP